MQLDQETAINNTKKYALLVNNLLSPNKIILYGSYAKGDWNESSDIDVAILVDKIDDNYLNIATTLCKLTRNIDYRIEPVLLDENNDISGFIQNILQYGIVIYDKNQNTI